MEPIDRKKRRIVRRPASDHMGVRSIDEKAPFSTRCSPAHFLKVVSKHVLTNEAKVDALNDIGFGDLLKLCTPILQIQLCRWICVHFDFAYSRLEVGVGKNLIKFEESDVHEILGIPRGDTTVNVEGPWVDIEDMAVDFSMQNVKGMTTSWNHILEFIKEDRFDRVFVRAFILYAMAVLLAPTFRREIRLQFLHLLRDCSKIKSLNWCQYVHRSTVNGIKKWWQARGREGNRRTYAAGCMYVLMIWYMEKTYIEGFTVLTKFPLSSAWTEDLVCERLTLEMNYFKKFGLVEPKPSNVRNPTYSGDHSHFRKDHNDAYPREIPHEDVPSSSLDPYAKIYSNIQSLKQCIQSHDVSVCNYIQQIKEQLMLLKSQQKPQSTEHHPNMGFDTGESPSAFTSNPPQQPTEST